MASMELELLAAARLLMLRAPGERGRMSRARVRRAISTVYYALFHFILDEATSRIVGGTAIDSRRRRILARSFKHDGLVNSLNRLKSEFAPSDYAEFLRKGGGDQPVATPHFVRSMASVFADAQHKRHDADYDLNKSLGENDAKAIIARTERAIADWRAADSASDRDFKHALSILLLIQGKLRT